jgi:hypothetical protein
MFCPSSEERKQQWLYCHFQRKPATKEGMENPYGDREGCDIGKIL